MVALPRDTALNLNVQVGMGSFRSDLPLDGTETERSYRGPLRQGEPTGSMEIDAGMGDCPRFPPCPAFPPPRFLELESGWPLLLFFPGSFLVCRLNNRSGSGDPVFVVFDFQPARRVVIQHNDLLVQFIIKLLSQLIHLLCNRKSPILAVNQGRKTADTYPGTFAAFADR